MPFGLGIWELVVLAGVLVLLFGAKGAPAIARRLGTGVRELKDAVTEVDPRSFLDPNDDAAGRNAPREHAAPAAPDPPAPDPPAQPAPRDAGSPTG